MLQSKKREFEHHGSLRSDRTSSKSSFSMSVPEKSVTSEFETWFRNEYPIYKGNAWEKCLTRFVDCGLDDLEFLMDLVKVEHVSDERDEEDAARGNVLFSLDYLLEHVIEMDKPFQRNSFRRKVYGLIVCEIFFKNNSEKN